MALSICSLNVQGLKNSHSRLSLLRQVGLFHPSLLCIQETNINVMFDLKFNIPHFVGHYNSAVHRFNGTAIFLKTECTAETSAIICKGGSQRISFKRKGNSFVVYNTHLPHSDVEALDMIERLDTDMALFPSHQNIVWGLEFCG